MFCLNRLSHNRSHSLSGNSVFPVSSSHLLGGDSPRTELGRVSRHCENRRRLPRFKDPGISQWELHYSLMRINTLHRRSTRQKISGPAGYEPNMTSPETTRPLKDHAEGSERFTHCALEEMRVRMSCCMQVHSHQENTLVGGRLGEDQYRNLKQ